MSVRVGYQFHCDRPDCDETIPVVAAPDDVMAHLRRRGWGISRTGKLRHFCPRHAQTQGPPSRTAPARHFPTERNNDTWTPNLRRV